MSPLQRPILRVAVAAVVLAGAAGVLTGCTSDPTPQATGGPTDCSGKVDEVLLGDDSAHQAVAFDAADSPKAFNLPTAPAPTCAYRSTTESQQGTSDYTVTHRSYLYVGISDADAKKLIAAIQATGAAAPWTPAYSNVPTDPPPSTPSNQDWDYNVAGAAGADRGSMGYTYVAPLNPGMVVQAGLSGTPNVLRIETEIRSPKK
jgi:hypothetical protein